MGLTGGFARASAAGWRSLQAMPIAPACAVVVAPCAPSAPCWPCAAPGGSCAARRRGAGANRRIQMRTASNVCLKQQATTLVISCIYRGLYLPSLMWMWLVFVCGFPFSSKRWGGFFIFLELWRKDFFLKCFPPELFLVVRRFKVDSSIENLGSSRSDEWGWEWKIRKAAAFKLRRNQRSMRSMLYIIKSNPFYQR